MDEVWLIFPFYGSNCYACHELLLSGVDLNCTSSFFSQKPNTFLDGATALIVAANEHANNFIFEFAHQLDFFRTNNNMETALHRYKPYMTSLSSACWSNNYEIVQFMVERGFPVDNGNITGLTPCRIVI